MGKNARIAELEHMLKEAKARAKVAAEVIDFVRELSELPEDAVLLYTLTGQRMSHQIGLTARRVLEKIG